MEKALEILKKEYPLICDMSFEWGWKSCEEAMKHKTCEGCVYEEKDDGFLNVECAFCLRNSNDNFKPKDKQC